MKRDLRELLRDLRLLRDNQRHDQVDDCNSAEASEERKNGQQADNGRVNAEILAQACAYARYHAVRGTAGQWSVVCVHILLLSIISTETYAKERRKLQVTIIYILPNGSL